MRKTISDLFTGAAAKYLSEVDANPQKSNQHEIGGLVKIGFKQFLGEPTGSNKLRFPTQMVYLEEGNDQPEIITTELSWYDSRANNPNRSPELRLYYPSNEVTRRMQAGDFFLIAQFTNSDLLIVICPPNTTHESQLRSLFSISSVKPNFTRAELNLNELPLPLVFLLESIGYIFEWDPNEKYLEQLIERFGDKQFPTTKEFSEFARSLSGVTAENPPDTCLMKWMEMEEILFRSFEKFFVSKKLEAGFGTENQQVDNFIQYSLSVQNRRKTRAGSAFEKHLSVIFHHHHLRYEQGSNKRTTENRKKPDFLFPSFDDYHNTKFQTQNLRLLGAKTTCKDRWRQVISEGERVSKKHLITLEAAISDNQIDEMKANNLQLIVPKDIQKTYSNNSKKWLIDLETFIEEIKIIQS